jgi:predicted nuclease of predicted toxin-antitoxin system
VRVLFDQGTPAPLRHHLAGHDITTAYELGWGNLKNGDLLQQAEAQGFEVLVTTDQNLQYQQNLASRKITVIVLSTTSWPRIQKVLPRVVDAINNVQANSYVEVLIP